MAPTAMDALLNIASSSSLKNAIGGPHDALLADGRLNPAATPNAATLASIADAQRSGVLTTVAVAATLLTLVLLYGLCALYLRLHRRRRAWHEEPTPYPALRKDLNRVSTPMPAVSLNALGMPKYVGYAVARDEGNGIRVMPHGSRGSSMMAHAPSPARGSGESEISETLRHAPPGLVDSASRSDSTLV
ncbi:hypothetical protein BD626DRAFT_624295 [Schizophyllum amplum]|uniref:Uncharacterized protein n=1 Tax=Schizophyllum amplum TaxID=97359 RepID=A0A550CVL6_9AGAR|nr:hypothetical protein BD626DRAFT_624295 [Auriculariopsis ampla]